MSVRDLLSAASGVGGAADPYFYYVSLLLTGDGTNGAQNNTFLDSSTNNFTITRNGNTTQGTFTPFSLAAGQWSNYFDGSSNLQVPNNAAFNLSGDFTIEAWVYPTSTPTNSSIFAEHSNGIDFGFDGSAHLSYGQNFNYWILNSSAAPANNTWSHCALSRASGTVRLFINGVQVATTTDSTSFSSATNYIGFSGSTYFPGYISNFRLVNGTAVYTSNFTPSTAPLTAITNTALLTCQSNNFKDNSSNNFTITPAGDTKVTAFSPFAPSAAYSASTNGGSAYFDGSGDYLTAPNNSAFDLSTGDFTVEMWFYSNIANSNYQRIYGCNTGTGVTNETVVFEISASGLTMLCFSGSTRYGLTTEVPISVNQWYHLALVRNGTTVTGYINGVSVGSSTLSGSVNNPTGAFPQVGAWQAGGSYSRYINGYISDLRIVKGTAVYTANFTPPTSPLTAISGTSLLLNCTNAGIIDNAGKNDIETVGNAQISTSVKKYGTGSMYFDGSGNYLTMLRNSNLQFGTGGWTIEMWFYITSASGTQVLLSGTSGGLTAGAWEIYAVDGSGAGCMNFANSSWADYKVQMGSVPSINTWYHLAITRSGTSTKLFLNGVLQNTTTVPSGLNVNGTGSTVIVGAQGSILGSLPLNGYIDDLRITKGVARYTANFTPPTSAFPTY